MKSVPIFALFLVTVWAIWATGCGNDDDDAQPIEVNTPQPRPPDTKGPEILRFSPADGAEVAAGEFIFLFSEAMDRESVNDGVAFEPLPPHPRDQWNFVWSGPQLVLTLALTGDTRYTLTIPKDFLKDKAGNVAAEHFSITFKFLAVPLENTDPKGQMGPGDPHASGNVDNSDDRFGGIYIAKEDDGRWHVVGAGLTPWGGTNVEMIARAIKADGAKGQMVPEGRYVDDGNDDDNEVFDSPEGGQIDLIEIQGDTVHLLAWYNGTGAWDGVWFTAEGAFVLFEHLGFSNEKTGGIDSACPKVGDRNCLVTDPLPEAPPERIFIGGDKPNNWKHPSKSAPFALGNK